MVQSLFAPSEVNVLFSRNYVLMFVNILISFMKIAFLALLLVIAFALAFYMLMFEPDEMVSEPMVHTGAFNLVSIV